MRIQSLIIAVIISVIAVNAATFKYNFKNACLSEALTQIAEEHPEIHINFIYNELDRYKVTTAFTTESPYEALRRTIGLNPVSIVNKGDRFYIEALQHGKYVYSGQVLDNENEPVVGASIMILAPKDSTVITYGSSGADGRFTIPCDKSNIMLKLSCVGYKTAFVSAPGFSVGKIILEQLPIQLYNLSVEASAGTLSPDKTTYIPTVRQKNASQDAIDLLRRMAVPQLVINPADNSVKDVFGNRVPVYINYNEADIDELSGMKVTNVRKVEFLEYPTDPRFKGEQRVVNIIVQEYEYGGYTKASESFRTLNGVFNTTDFFSRFTYKKLTYDLYAGSSNESYHHSGTDNNEGYLLRQDGNTIKVLRKETFEDSRTRSNNFPVTLRATYQTPRFTARNTLSFTHSSTPEKNTTGKLDVDIYPENNYTYSRSNPARDNTLYYHGAFWGVIGSKVSFDINPSFRHTHRNNSSFYESTLMLQPFNNNITENVYNWNLQASGRMVLDQKNQISLFLGGGQNIYKLLYKGTNNFDDSYYNSFMACDLRYRFQTQTVNITSFVGFLYDYNSMNGITTADACPRLGVNAWFRLNRKSQISASLQYHTSTPGIGMKANDIIRNNEFMYFTGNPQLRNWRELVSNVAYNLFRDNSFSMGAFTGFNRQFNRVATIYRPFEDGQALIRDYVNDGSYNHFYIGAQANYKLFNNSLQLYANLTQHTYRITGNYRETYTPTVRIQLQGAYYWKSFNVIASWGSPECNLTENSNVLIHRRNFHMLSAGWGNGTWTVNLSALNIFNKGWRYQKWEKHLPLYSDYQQYYNPSGHRSLALSVTYTVGYGKKVQRGNEVGAASTSPSAIIE